MLSEFQIESKELVADLNQILTSIEGQLAQAQRLKEFGNKVDRIMGAASSLALSEEKDHALHIIADYTGLCKSVSYKAAELTDNQELYDISIALLMDTVEALEVLLNRIEESAEVLRKEVTPAFADRLKWVIEQFNHSSGTTASTAEKLNQDQIDELMKKLGGD